MKKFDLGQFNTKKETWLKPHIAEFILKSECSHCLDPFAGAGDLLDTVHKLGNFSVEGLDIDPTLGWQINDGLDEVPYRKDTIVVTNPPYLSKNSAARHDSDSYRYFLSNSSYTDLYQIALERVIRVYDKSVFIIPETYFGTNMFKNDIHSITILEDNPFEDTECPVCVVCFNKRPFMTMGTYSIYKNDEYVLDSLDLEDTKKFLRCDPVLFTDFNNKNGNIGLRGVDGVKSDDRIRFCLPSELDYDKELIKVSSRAITLIDVMFLDGKPLDVNKLISKANQILNDYRTITKDITLSPFKNNNKEGIRRRRLDYALAKKILNKSALGLDK